jgi:hypothetical protein
MQGAPVEFEYSRIDARHSSLARAVLTIAITFEHVATISDISTIDVDSLSEISKWYLAAWLQQCHITHNDV